MSRGATSRTGADCFLAAFFPRSIWAFEGFPFDACTPVGSPWGEEPAVGTISSRCHLLGVAVFLEANLDSAPWSPEDEMAVSSLHSSMKR